MWPARQLPSAKGKSLGEVQVWVAQTCNRWDACGYLDKGSVWSRNGIRYHFTDIKWFNLHTIGGRLLLLLIPSIFYRRGIWDTESSKLVKSTQNHDLDQDGLPWTPVPSLHTELLFTWEDRSWEAFKNLEFTTFFKGEGVLNKKVQFYFLRQM